MYISQSIWSYPANLMVCTCMIEQCKLLCLHYLYEYPNVSKYSSFLFFKKMYFLNKYPLKSTHTRKKNTEEKSYFNYKQSRSGIPHCKKKLATLLHKRAGSMI